MRMEAFTQDRAMFRRRTCFTELKNDVEHPETCIYPGCTRRIGFPTIMKETSVTRKGSPPPGILIDKRVRPPAPAMLSIPIPHKSLEVLKEQLTLAAAGQATNVDIAQIIRQVANALLCEIHTSSAESIAQMWERDFYHEVAQLQTHGLRPTSASPDYTTNLANATIDMTNSSAGSDGMVVVTTKTQKLRILLAPNVGPGGDDLGVFIANAGETPQPMVAQQRQSGTPPTSDANAGETSQSMVAQQNQSSTPLPSVATPAPPPVVRRGRDRYLTAEEQRQCPNQ